MKIGNHVALKGKYGQIDRANVDDLNRGMERHADNASGWIMHWPANGDSLEGDFTLVLERRPMLRPEAVDLAEVRLFSRAGTEGEEC